MTEQGSEQVTLQQVREEISHVLHRLNSYLQQNFEGADIDTYNRELRRAMTDVAAGIHPKAPPAPKPEPPIEVGTVWCERGPQPDLPVYVDSLEGGRVHLLSVARGFRCSRAGGIPIEEFLDSHIRLRFRREEE